MESQLSKDIVEDKEDVEGEDVLGATDGEDEMDEADMDVCPARTHNNPLQHHQR